MVIWGLAGERRSRLPIWTVGHSTHPIEEFLRILHSADIRQLIDVRTIPKSRRNPQFNRENLPGGLGGAGIQYKHMPKLGGLRHPRPDSINVAWRNASFRGYADYMQTAEFQVALQTLLGVSSAERTAIMCAESVPWRCHRSLIADALLARGIEVLDILSATSIKPHTLTAFARIDGNEVTYPESADDENLQLKFDDSPTLR